MSEKKQRRVHRIIELLEQHGKMETATLSQQLGVTELTVRRDIEHLDAMGVARRVYGGVVLNAGRSFEPPFGFRLEANVAGKQAIARAVVQRIARGENVALDFGTKAYHVAQEMRRSRLQCLVAPTSAQVIEVLGQGTDIHVLVPGGELKPVELSFYGSATEDFFRSRRWDIAIVGVAGVSVENDALSDYNESDARVKAAMCAAADRVVVMAERQHLGSASFAPVCALSRVSTVVTDAVGPHETLTALEQRGIEVVRAVTP
ncbi:MAG TPA: DeoR/GlpR family DNA-binding transcription regulator [Cellulomonas sp.]